MAGGSGQRGRAAAIGAEHGTTQGPGEEPGEFGLEAVAAGLVLGAEGISRRTAGVDGRAARPAALWGGVEGIGRAEGAAVDERDVAQGRLDGSGVKGPAQRTSEKSANGGALACGDADDVDLDRPAIGDGTLANRRQCRSAGCFDEEELTQGATEHTNSHL